MPGILGSIVFFWVAGILLFGSWQSSMIAIDGGSSTVVAFFFLGLTLISFPATIAAVSLTTMEYLETRGVIAGLLFSLGVGFANWLAVAALTFGGQYFGFYETMTADLPPVDASERSTGAGRFLSVFLFTGLIIFALNVALKAQNVITRHNVAVHCLIGATSFVGGFSGATSVYGILIASS